MKLGVVAVAAALAWVSTGAAGAAQEIVAVDTGPGVTVRVLLLAPTESPSATLLMFPGGFGDNHFGEKNGKVWLGKNFLLRAARPRGQPPAGRLLGQPDQGRRGAAGRPEQERQGDFRRGRRGRSAAVRSLRGSRTSRFFRARARRRGRHRRLGCRQAGAERDRSLGGPWLAGPGRDDPKRKHVGTLRTFELDDARRRPIPDRA